jgi:hypothetical protein
MDRKDKMSKQSNRNLKAFNEVLEEYEKLKYNSRLISQNMEDERSGGISNPAQPSASDFVCDVENTITAIVHDYDMLVRIVNTFLKGKEELDKEQKNYYEQRIGLAFIKHDIWPTAKYFLSIRKGHEKT